MVYRTVTESSYDAYVSECPASAADRDAEASARKERLLSFPFAVMLKVSYPELDFVNRWCWEQFGPGGGDCLEMHSEYRSCTESTPHAHVGSWVSHWFEKTDYDFGFNEWYFASDLHRNLFISNIKNVNWGENYENLPPPRK